MKFIRYVLFNGSAKTKLRSYIKLKQLPKGKILFECRFVKL